MTHPTPDVLADLAAGLPVDAAATTHVEACVDCRETVEVIAASAEVLGATPDETMPPEVAGRLKAVLDAEVARRTSGASKAELDAESAAATARTALGSFGANPIGDKTISPRRTTSHT